MLTLNSQGKTLHSTKPLIMGILNVTPDSFYQKSRVMAVSEATDIAGKMLLDGASILDIGGQSTRPGASAISANEELDRIGAVIEAVVRHFGDAFISVDTYHSEVAKQVVKLGAHIINDISGGQYDASMFSTIGALNVPYVVMHVNESKDEMHHVKNEASIMPVLHDFFSTTCNRAKDAGIQQLILDPGFGFSKSPTQNFELISKVLNFPDVGLNLKFLEHPTNNGTVIFFFTNSNTLSQSSEEITILSAIEFSTAKILFQIEESKTNLKSDLNS